MDEAKLIFERGCEQLILGSGQIGNVHLSPEAEVYFAKKGCKVLLQSHPHPRSDRCVQQVACEEDRAFSRDLLTRAGAGRDSSRLSRLCPRCAPGLGRPENAAVVELVNERYPMPPALVDSPAP